MVFTRQVKDPELQCLEAEHLCLPVLTLTKATAISIASHPFSQVRFTFVRDIPSYFHLRNFDFLFSTHTNF